MFSRYEEYLNYDFSPDYWSDEGITIASAQLNKFSEEDWITLSRSWADKSTEWKVRCAETLDAPFLAEAIKVLLAMLHDADSNVVIAAADSLRSMPHSAIQLSPSSIDQLIELRERSGPVSKAVLNDFINRFQANN